MEVSSSGSVYLAMARSRYHSPWTWTFSVNSTRLLSRVASCLALWAWTIRMWGVPYTYRAPAGSLSTEQSGHGLGVDSVIVLSLLNMS